ncbi:MAG: HAD-IB family hydrolase [Actinomycetota bacterium]|nr:HAD-IB family hydrolase [Actinomycetota bacterium]
MEAAFFDLDKTVIARASLVAFGHPLYRGGLVSRSTVGRALVSQFVYMHLGASEDKLDRIRESVLTLARGWDRDKVSQIVRETLDEVVEPIIFAEALDLIEQHQAAGRLVYLISASPTEIVEPLGEYLGVDGTIASRAVVDADNRYTGTMAFYCYGPYKAEAIRELAQAEQLDLAASYAYSDSYTDLPMLEVVGNPVAVNPDRVLARLARERGWPAVQFVRPVRLRGRSPVRGLPTAAVAGAIVAVTGTALAVWRRSQRTPATGVRGITS